MPTSSTPKNDLYPSGSAAGGAAGTMADTTRAMTAEAKSVAAGVAVEAQKVAESKFDVGRAQIAGTLGAVAGALRQTSQQLRSGGTGLNAYVDRAARSVDGASRYLEGRSLAQLATDVEEYARREPAVFLGGALVAGLLGGRFLRSSHTPQQAAGHGSASSQPRDGGLDHAYTAQRPRQDEGSANEGEGSRTATRSYDAATRKYVESGRVEPAAKAARDALAGPEGQTLRDAEARARDTGLSAGKTPEWDEPDDDEVVTNPRPD